MRVLIAPMAAASEMGGPYARAAALCRALLEAGHETAFCAALDGNYRDIDGVKNYYAPVPSPLGLPMFIGKRMLKIAQKLNIQQKKEIHSFEEVLRFAGAVQKDFFISDIECIRKAIRDFKPDMIYSEFRLSAIIAGKMEKVPCAAGYSYPAQPDYASNPEFSRDARNYLARQGFPNIKSILEVFRWSDLNIVPSSYELEPIDGKNMIFTGPFAVPKTNSTPSALNRNKIVAYVGSGNLSQKLLADELTRAFHHTPYQVYIASGQLEPRRNDNIIVDRRFDFDSLMPDAAVYINHGGQNSIMTALLHGVPQIMCPGNVFERKYNADSVVKLGAGAVLKAEEFTAENISSLFSRFVREKSFSDHALKAGMMLKQLGGVKTAVKAMEESVKSNGTERANEKE